MAAICHFGFFTASFTYYVTGESRRHIHVHYHTNNNKLIVCNHRRAALNASNLSANSVVYVSATGAVDIVAYVGGILMLRYTARKWSCFWSFALAGVCMLIILAVPADYTTVVVTISMVGRLGITAAYAIIALYTAELFPTEVRNSAIGVSSMFGHIGSMAAPFVVDFLGLVAWYIPTTICGVALFVAAALVLLNPGTEKSRLVDHVATLLVLEAKQDNNNSGSSEHVNGSNAD